MSMEVTNDPSLNTRSEIPSGKPSRGRNRAAVWKGEIYRTIRRLHMYFGLFLLPWVLLYGTSAFMFNHPDGLLSDQTVIHFDAASAAETQLGILESPSKVAEKVIASLENSDSISKPGFPKLKLVRPEEAGFNKDTWMVTAKGGGQSHNVFLQLDGDGGSIRTRPEPNPGTPAPFARKRGVLLGGKTLADQVKEGVQNLLEKQGLKADEISVSAPPELSFFVEADGKLWKAKFNSQRGSVEAKPADSVDESISPRRFLTRLHRTHEYPHTFGAKLFWAIIVDLMAGSMIFWGSSGLFMWWQLKAFRVTGSLVLFASVASGLLLFWAMYHGMGAG